MNLGLLKTTTKYSEPLTVRSELYIFDIKINYSSLTVTMSAAGVKPQKPEASERSGDQSLLGERFGLSEK